MFKGLWALFFNMKKLLFISFFIIGCNTNSNQNIPVVENEPDIVNFNLNNELYEIDKEIINNPKSPNVYLKRALYHQNKRNFSSEPHVKFAHGN